MFILLHDTNSEGEVRPYLVNTDRIDYCSTREVREGARTLICLSGSRVDQKGEPTERKLWVLETTLDIAAMLNVPISDAPTPERKGRKRKGS